MKIGLIAVSFLTVAITGCGNEDSLNSLYNSAFTEEENHLLKCSVKNVTAIEDANNWHKIKKDNPDFSKALAFKSDCKKFHHDFRMKLCQYDTEERRSNRDAIEKMYSEKSSELFQAFLDSCRSAGIADPKERYLSKQNPKFKDHY